MDKNKEEKIDIKMCLLQTTSSQIPTRECIYNACRFYDKQTKECVVFNQN